MKTATVKEIKTDLHHKSQEELVQLCLTLARFKKENKELLTYLLFEADHESYFIDGVKEEVDEMLTTINTNSYFYIKKSVRKILKRIKTYIRYSKNKETEVILLLYFCEKMTEFRPSIKGNLALFNIFKRERLSLRKKISGLHEDLQYDYNEMLKTLETF